MVSPPLFTTPPPPHLPPSPDPHTHTYSHPPRSRGTIFTHMVCQLVIMSLIGASTLYTALFELVRMIKCQVSIGKSIIYYYHVALWDCPRHIFTWYFHGLPQICGSQVWHTGKRIDICFVIFMVPLFLGGSIIRIEFTWQ